MSNIIRAIINIYNNSNFSIGEFYKSRSRANNMGDALEEYIKDSFANTFNSTPEEKTLKYNEIFSFQGSQNNPPDFMLRGGDSVEVKKIESYNSHLALNSSYPKNKLFASSPMITTACRNAEEWTVKDIIYTVGVVKDNDLTDLSFVYGMDYAADEAVYENIKNKIKEGVETIKGVEFTETKELGRVNKVDPLKITSLRIRGMWQIKNPFNQFNYVYRKQESYFNFMCIINEDKLRTLPKDDIEELKRIEGICFENIQIQDTNNEDNFKSAILITFTREKNENS